MSDALASTGGKHLNVIVLNDQELWKVADASVEGAVMELPGLTGNHTVTMLYGSFFAQGIISFIRPFLVGREVIDQTKESQSQLANLNVVWLTPGCEPRIVIDASDPYTQNFGYFQRQWAHSMREMRIISDSISWDDDYELSQNAIDFLEGPLWCFGRESLYEGLKSARSLFTGISALTPSALVPFDLQHCPSFVQDCTQRGWQLAGWIQASLSTSTDPTVGGDTAPPLPVQVQVGHLSGSVNGMCDPPSTPAPWHLTLHPELVTSPVDWMLGEARSGRVLSLALYPADMQTVIPLRQAVAAHQGLMPVIVRNGNAPPPPQKQQQQQQQQQQQWGGGKGGLLMFVRKDSMLNGCRLLLATGGSETGSSLQAALSLRSGRSGASSSERGREESVALDAIGKAEWIRLLECLRAKDRGSSLAALLRWTPLYPSHSPHTLGWSQATPVGRALLTPLMLLLRTHPPLPEGSLIRAKELADQVNGSKEAGEIWSQHPDQPGSFRSAWTALLAAAEAHCHDSPEHQAMFELLLHASTGSGARIDQKSGLERGRQISTGAAPVAVATMKASDSVLTLIDIAASKKRKHGDA